MTANGAKPVQSILFACSLNSVRSPMAEGVAKDLFGRRVYIDSAGLRKSDRDPFALTVLKEIGIDFADDSPLTIEEVSFESFDLIVTLSQEAKERISQLVAHSAVELLHWPIDDPTLSEGSREARLAAYRAARERIRALIRQDIAPRIARAPKENG